MTLSERHDVNGQKEIILSLRESRYLSQPVKCYSKWQEMNVNVVMEQVYPKNIDVVEHFSPDAEKDVSTI